MPHPFRDDQIQGWASDFLEGPRFAAVRGPVRECAPEVLQAFLGGACAARDREPGDLEEADLRVGALEHAARLALPAGAHEGVPDLLALFLEDLEAGGRLAGGRSLGLALRAARGAYQAASGGRIEPIVRPAPAVGRNDPCPCGSGRKYKKCCLGIL